MYIMGIDPTVTHTTPQFDLGQIGWNITSDGAKAYTYVQANGAITAAGYVCDFGNDHQAAMCTTTTTAPGTGAGKQVGVAAVAFADNDYGWLQVYGKAAAVRVSASCAAYTNLNSTATAGQLDDDATAGAEVIDGIVIDTAEGGAAGTEAGLLTWPKVGRTL